jgi:hypothetical protein
VSKKKRVRAAKARRSFFVVVKDTVNDFITLRLVPFFKLCNIHTAFAVAGIVGPFLLSISDLSAGLSSPGYSIVKDSISSLALTNAGWIQTIGFLVLGLLVEIFTAGLLFNIKKGARWFYLGIAIFSFFGFAMLLIGAFRTDVAGVVDTARTLEGRIHGFVSSATFILFPIAILCLMPSIKRDPNWKYLYVYTLITFVLAVILVVTIKVLPEGNLSFGLIERLLVANAIIWIEVAAVNMFILSLKRKSLVEGKSS